MSSEVRTTACGFWLTQSALIPTPLLLPPTRPTIIRAIISDTPRTKLIISYSYKGERPIIRAKRGFETTRRAKTSHGYE
eukprot:scaffold275081_cov26-Prasinocladus_malaysianus.AAC.1